MKVVAEPPKNISALSISVIVPILNEAKFIGKTLDGILAQDYPSDALEVLVVDGGSTDGTREVVENYGREHPTVKLLDNPKRWSSAARNVGIQASTGSVVVIVDGHCEFFDDQYFQHVSNAFQDESIHCLGRPQPLDVTDGSKVQQAIALARSSRLGHHPDSFIYSEQQQKVPAHSVAVAYRKSIFDEIGNFDESFDACEDVELNHRIDKAGLDCLLVPNIRLRYHPRASLVGLFRQMTRYGRGRVRLLRKHSDTFSFKSLLPAFFVAGLILGPPAGALFPVLWIPYASVVGFYVAVLLYFSISLSQSASRLSLLGLISLVFLAIHLGAGYGSLKELLLGRSAGDAFDR